MGGFDDGPDDGCHCGDRQEQAHPIKATGPRVARVGDQEPARHQCKQGDRDVDQEDRPPPEVLQQQTPGDWTCGHREAGHARPDADGHRPLADVGEDVDDDRQRRREDHRGADPHEGAGADELFRRLRQRCQPGRDREDDQPELQGAAPAGPVAEVAERQQQRREHQGVCVDDPLEVRRGGRQLLAESGQSHVHDRVVDDHHEQAQAEHGEDPPPCTGPLRGSDLRENRHARLSFL